MNDLVSGLASSNFIAVNKSAIKLLGLEEAILFAELISECKYWEARGEVDNGWFFSTVENLEEKTTLNGYSQRKILDKLLKMDLVYNERRGIPAKRYIKINENQVIKLFHPEMYKNLISSCANFKHLEVENLECNKIESNKIDNNKINNNIKENIKESEVMTITLDQYNNLGKSKKTLEPIYQDIMDFYNSTCNRNLTLKNKNTVALIKARLKDGFTLDDFKSVITFKNQEWSKDSNMSKYLVPTTLFGNKFVNYLEQASQPQNNPISYMDEWSNI